MPGDRHCRGPILRLTAWQRSRSDLGRHEGRRQQQAWRLPV